MATAKIVTCFIFISILNIVVASNTPLAPPSYTYKHICKSLHCQSINKLMLLSNCTVILGDLTIVIERGKKEDFANISFPLLKEVTGYMIVYRVFGLESIGTLFPNLARIRGEHLVYNFALIIYDLPHLLEIGLYSLLKVDRGGVIIWGGVHTCYMDSLQWEVITNGRRVVFPPEISSECNVYPSCSCSADPATNFCWNNRKCQRFLDGPEAESCDSQCFGCKKAVATACTLCRYYTHEGRCLSACPNGTVVLQVNKYCISEKECVRLGGWSWDRACVFECPLDHVVRKTAQGTICEKCDNCKKTCPSLEIQTLQHVQAAEKCVYINGSLTIHIRSMLPEALDEMGHYLSIIREVTDYIMIYGSISITSLHFLSSLKLIRGRNLQNGRYSLIVIGMQTLQALFTPNVIQNLIVENGTMAFYENPMLCASSIKKLEEKFPKTPTVLDIPLELNGYHTVCREKSVRFRVEEKNETSAMVHFNPVDNNHIQYSILFVRIPRGTEATFVPTPCTESEWHSISVPDFKLNNDSVQVELTSLCPASLYALCIETYDSATLRLAHSPIINFNTTVGKPEPPFIIELVASSFEEVVIRWVDHKDYRPHIDYYELIVHLIEIRSEDIAARDHCVPVEDEQELDYSRHAVVMRPPKNYERSCESMCGVLSTVTVGAMTEDYFDIRSSLQFDYDETENPHNLINTTFGRYVKTLVLNGSSPRSKFRIGNLAPFRDYRFKIRACVGAKCSRFESGVVRTLRLENVDVPHIKSLRPEQPGYINVKWRPPKVTNGPVLAYNVEILPVMPGMEKLLPLIWCVPGNITDVMAKVYVTNKYFIRICSTTLGSKYVCSNRRRLIVSIESPTWWWIAVPFGILLCIASLILGRLLKIDRRMNDEISLVNISSSYMNESDPPIQMADPCLYYVSLRKSDFE